jgi:hypothetical protein
MISNFNPKEFIPTTTSIHSIDSTLVNNNSILQNSIAQLDNLKLDFELNNFDMEELNNINITHITHPKYKLN